MDFLNSNEKPEPRRRKAILMTMDSSPHIEATNRLGCASKLINNFTSNRKLNPGSGNSMKSGIEVKSLRVSSAAKPIHIKSSPANTDTRLLFSIISTSPKPTYSIRLKFPNTEYEDYVELEDVLLKL